MADKFQPDFYVTCASVIPVLFLAVAVEGRAYRWALSTSERAERYSNTSVRIALGLEPAVRRERRWPGARESLADAAAEVLVLIALLIVLAGGLGEGLALAVLYQKSETPGDRVIVLSATLVLVAAVIAGPAVALGRSLWLVVIGPWAANWWQGVRSFPEMWRALFSARAAEGQSTASPEGRRASSVRPHYDG
jgi:hypothetical protein